MTPCDEYRYGTVSRVRGRGRAGAGPRPGEPGCPERDYDMEGPRPLLYTAYKARDSLALYFHGYNINMFLAPKNCMNVCPGPQELYNSF